MSDQLTPYTAPNGGGRGWPGSRGGGYNGGWNGNRGYGGYDRERYPEPPNPAAMEAMAAENIQLKARLDKLTAAAQGN